MKTINISLIILTLLFTFTSCNKEFLEVEPKGQFLSENYYSTPSEIYSGIVGAYDVLRKNSGGFENMIAMMNAGSDDHVAGGGGSSDGAGIQGFSNYTINPDIMPNSFWNDYYQGIARTNTLLQKIPNVFVDPKDKEIGDRYIAECKALRAFYYFNLINMFKNVPLFTEPVNPDDIYNVVQAAPADVWAQIEKDLNEAIPNLPATVPVATEGGRLTKGAAQAILGKVFLFQKKNAQAANVLAEVNGTPGGTSQYGYKLLSNFADLWVTSNKFHSENILECSHSAIGNSDWGWWGSGRDEGNTLNVMVGPRSYALTNGSDAADLQSGWSFNVFTQDFIDFIKGDPRYDATVFDLNKLEAEGKATYLPGYQNTGYFLNKFLPRKSDVRTGGGALELNYRQNTPIIRLADTYLMEAEALGATGARAQALLDAVRARVGLPSVPVSLVAIKNERRLELAGEGHRFFDLVRWGDAASILSPRGFVSGKNEIFPIPQRERINENIKQNPNY